MTPQGRPIPGRGPQVQSSGAGAITATVDLAMCSGCFFVTFVIFVANVISYLCV
jgi:hypothetical protein